MAVMMLCLVPIGLFMAILPETAPERADFVSAHQSLGLSIAALVIARIVWLRLSPAPAPLAAPGTWEHRAARLVHGALYAALLAFPLSGVLIAQGPAAEVYGLAVPLPQAPAAAAELAVIAHAWVLPTLFYASLAAHLAAVARRHFAERDTRAVRRMLR
jgi:cytochrome b561